MRLARTFGGVALVLALGGTARADTVPPTLYTAKVVAPNAEVHSGQSAKMVVTNRLAQGVTVEVVKELPDGWLAIKPPVNSFSWVNARLVARIPNSNSWVVHADDTAPVPVLYGSEVVKDKPSVKSVDIKRGSQVVVIGPGQPSDEGTLLPIDPPPTEVRYLQASAVAKNNNPAPAVGGPAAFPGQPALVAGPHPKWLAAQAAEQAGERQKAEQIYSDLYWEVVNSDPDLARQASNRYSYLHGSATASAPPAYAGYPASADSRLAPVPASGSNQGTVAYRPAQPAQPTSYGQRALQPSGGGRLRFSGRCVDGARAYVLENSQGQLLMYVTAQPGLNLDFYVNRNVELFGAIVYRGDLRSNYITVSQVNPL